MSAWAAGRLRAPGRDLGGPGAGLDVGRAGAEGHRGACPLTCTLDPRSGYKNVRKQPTGLSKEVSLGCGFGVRRAGGAPSVPA